MTAEAHAPHLSLMPVDAEGNAPNATHVAVSDGDWFDPGTWANGQVPDNGALVHIPAGVSVAYEGASDAHVFMVRVDGDLKFTADAGVTTKMVVDTMITSTGSTLIVDARADTSGTVDIEFAEGTPAAHADFYTDHSEGDGVIGRYDWDPSQLSLGLVASGAVDIKGQEVDANAKLATGPGAGATEIVLDLDAASSGWEPGQQIVIGGVKFSDRDADGIMQTQDEVRTITDIRMEDGKMVVGFDEAAGLRPLRPDGPDHRAGADGQRRKPDAERDLLVGRRRPRRGRSGRSGGLAGRRPGPDRPLRDRARPHHVHCTTTTSPCTTSRSRDWAARTSRSPSTRWSPAVSTTPPCTRSTAMRGSTRRIWIPSS